MAAVQTYNSSGDPIYPKGLADGVEYAYGTSNMTTQNIDSVKDALDVLFSTTNELTKKITGADEIEESLALDIQYGRNSDKTEYPEQWSEDFESPDSTHIYTWKKTTFYWDQVQVGEPYYEIVASAEYPETLFLFCAVGSNISELGGPEDYPSGDSSTVVDSNNPGIYWHTTPLSVGVSAPFAYMASRSRAANQSWDDIPFGFALYGSYAFSSVVIEKYNISTESTGVADPNTICNLSTGELGTPWVSSVDYASLNSGTNYIYKTLAITVNTLYLKAYNSNYWATPTLISVITK